MIFYDQKTAQEIRERAEHEIKDFMFEMIKDYLNYVHSDEITDESLENYINMKFHADFPKMARLLLFRSGLIFPNDGHGINPIKLYNDNLDTWKSIDALHFMGAFDEHGITGGIHEGNIHT